MQFAPRLRDLGDQRLYRRTREQRTRHLGPRIKGTIRQEFILRHWDDLLRLAGSLKLGWVTASLFISKLQAYPRQNVLARALQAYGRLVKTRFILRSSRVKTIAGASMLSSTKGNPSMPCGIFSL
jgi:TnpA family transposase